MSEPAQQASCPLGAENKAQKLLDHMEQLKNTIHDLSNELQQLKLRINPFIPVATSIYTRLERR